MVRRKAVLERYAALRCRWNGSPCAAHVARRPVRAPCRGDASSAGVSSTGCWACRCAGAAGTCAWASGWSSGATVGRGAVRARAGRGRRAAGR
eukprot:383065-Prymnesium_polylepis.1